MMVLRSLESPLSGLSPFGGDLHQTGRRLPEEVPIVRDLDDLELLVGKRLHPVGVEVEHRESVADEVLGAAFLGDGVGVDPDVESLVLLLGHHEIFRR